jgi:queuine tRNA-ribosyltransferase
VGRAVTFAFELLKERGAARLGRLYTPHGTIETPAFVAVGTQAAVKTLTPQETREVGTQVIFANTYHLYLRPGEDVVAGAGGVHRFMAWDAPVMTDSGGFQVFSLGAGLEHGVGKVANIFPGEAGGVLAGRRAASRAPLMTVSEEEVRFKSHLDGSAHVFTPEKSIAVQRALGADMILAFDECTSPLHDEAYTARSAARTHRWAERSLRYFQENGPLHGYEQALYGIVQGGAFETVRKESARIVAGMDFQGMAIGGNLGRTKDDMRRVLAWTTPLLPPGRPRHLLGIGEVADLFDGVERGCDTFDCVAPTRNARNGGVLVRFDDDKPAPKFRLNIRNARFSHDPRPLEEGCDCSTCRTFSRAYLRHLFKAGEPLGQRLATIHNLRFMARLMSEIRQSLQDDTFADLKRAWLEPAGLYPPG